MTGTVIEIDRFSFSLNGRTILKDISFSVEEGGYVSIVGPNGAGKSTLLKCISRIHRGGTGNISIAGRKLRRYRQRELARKLSYVPQADGFSSPFTVYEFAMMGRYPYLDPFSSPGAADRRAVDRALELTGTSEFAERAIGSLSGGERQKAFIAAALAQEAGIILLDEPTSFLDPRHEAEIFRLLSSVHRERGVTVMIVTHDINSAVLTSRTILALKEGAVAFKGPAEEFMNEKRLQDIFEKPFLLARHPCCDRRFIAPEAP